MKRVYLKNLLRDLIKRTTLKWFLSLEIPMSIRISISPSRISEQHKKKMSLTCSNYRGCTVLQCGFEKYRNCNWCSVAKPQCSGDVMRCFEKVLHCPLTVIWYSLAVVRSSMVIFIILSRVPNI